MKICWASDTHLNAAEDDKRQQFYQHIIDEKTDAVFITGDISESPLLSLNLQELLATCQQPIYFVLGNHDYFYSAVKRVRDEVRQLCQQQPMLHWMNEVDYITLDENTALVGVDGWADGRYGNFKKSTVHALDGDYIADYSVALEDSREALLKKMKYLADEDAKLLQEKLHLVASKGFMQVIVLTHVPPFPEASWHQGSPSDEFSLPYFASKATGYVLNKFSKANKAVKLQVYCGHSHSYRRCEVASNLVVETSAATTGEPAIAKVLTLDAIFSP